MKVLSAEAQALVERLAPSRAREDERLDAIAALGVLGEPAAIPPMVSLLVDERLGAATASAIARILRAQPAKLCEELAAHGVGGDYSNRMWFELLPDRVAALGGSIDGWAALCLASLHRSGWVREQALRALTGRNDDPAALPFLFLRLNDWVAPVREAARRAVMWRLTPEHADALLRAFPVVLSLRQRRRADHSQVVDAVLALLRSAEARPALRRGLDSGERTTRREAYRILLQLDGDPTLVARALGDRDLLVRLGAVERLGQLPAGDERDAALARALTDPAARVRRAALPFLAGQPEERVRALCEPLLCDANRGLRAYAREALSRLGAFDAPARYRTLIAAAHTSAELRGAISGLVDCGAEDDVLVLLDLAAEPRPKVRAAAVQAIAALDRDSADPFLVALADPSRRVSRTALRALCARVRLPLADSLLALAERDVPAHAREHAIEVLCALFPWRRLEYMLRGAASANLAVAALCRPRVGARTSMPPSADERTAVLAALRVPGLPAETVAHVEGELRLWDA